MQVPVPVELVAHRLNLQVKAALRGDDISGVLVVDNDQGMIGFNQAQAPVRQRFTIAHECGHFLLHQTENEASGLFVDRRYAAFY